jgi:hypothetical protein
MKIEIEELPINFEDIYVTNYSDVIDEYKKTIKIPEFEFKYIKLLKGDKYLLKKAFVDTYYEIIND